MLRGWAAGSRPGYDVRLDWGGEGVAALGRECAVLVVVDVLSFSTTTDLVVGRGGRVLPVRWRDERGVAQARAAGAVVAGEGAFTLRPSSVTEIPPGTLLALPSPNGATLCAAAAATGAHVLAGCLRNASAVAAKAHELGGADRAHRRRGTLGRGHLRRTARRSGRCGPASKTRWARARSPRRCAETGLCRCPRKPRSPPGRWTSTRLAGCVVRPRADRGRATAATSRWPRGST